MDQYWAYNSAAVTMPTAIRLPGRGDCTARARARYPHPVRRMTSAYILDSVA